jgi:hypothetical protein
MKKTFIWLIPALVAGFVFTGCTPKARYERMLKQETESGIRYDSLFMGLYLGMPEKEFYTRCWNLNRQGLVRQGSTNTSVLYEMKHELKYPASMDFYPRFVEGKIAEMPVQFKYSGWAPWNKKLSAENLETDVYHYYKNKYGSGFIKVRHPKRGLAYVQIKGNRRITIFIGDESTVWAVMTDLTQPTNVVDTTQAQKKALENLTREINK